MGFLVRVFVWFRLGCFIVARRSFESCVVDLVRLVWNFVVCLCVCVVLFVLRRFLLCEVWDLFVVVGVCCCSFR